MRFARLLPVMVLVAVAMVGNWTTPAQAVPTTAVTSALTLTPPDVPQGGNVMLSATFTMTAVDPADGPVTLDVTQSSATHSLLLFGSTSNVSGRVVESPLRVRCDWTAPAVGDEATLVMGLGDSTHDPPGTVITVSAGAEASATDLGRVAKTVTVTDADAVAAEASIVAEPSMTPPDGSVTVTATFRITRLDADWGPITVSLGVPLNYPTTGAAAVGSTANLTGCQNPIPKGMSTIICTWSSPVVDELAVLKVRFSNFTAYGPGREIQAGATVSTGLNQQIRIAGATAIITITGATQVFPPTPVEHAIPATPIEHAPKFTG